MCRKDFLFFIICYKVINVYLSNIHFHNTDTTSAHSIKTLENPITVISEFNKLHLHTTF